MAKTMQEKLMMQKHTAITVRNAPSGFLDQFQVADQQKWTDAATLTFSFALVFVTTSKQIEDFMSEMDEKMMGDAAIWLAYPKKTSKRFSSEIHRDNGFQVMGQWDFEPVTQIAIDEDWSALRFRRVAFIAKMTRSFAMTEEGKNKTQK
jgi:hypothetical protein